MKLGRIFALAIAAAAAAALATIPPATSADQEPRDQGSTPDTNAPVRAETGADEQAAGPAQLGVEADEPYGQYLVDAGGRALYLFTPDEGQTGSACYGACAQAWPPLLTTTDPRAAAPGLDPDKLGTIERRDGSKQVTYGGWPLHYYVRDQGPGEVTGQDIHSFGGEWYLVSPQGNKITETK